MSSFKMPYSNFHELNLDWMLEEFKKFVEIIDSKINTFDEFEAAWAQFQADVNSDLQTYLAAMEAYKTFINGQISSFESSINNDFNTFKNTMQNQYTDFINNYLQTLGIVQTTGQSTTEVMSQKAVSDIVDTHEDRLDDLEETVNGEGGISDRLETAESSISNLEDTYSEIVEDISEIESDILVDQSRINTLENNDASTRARVGSLESRASGTDASIAALTGRVTSAENEINSVKARTSALESDNTSNKARLDDLESELPLVKNRVSTLETKVNDLETDNTSNKARISDLELHDVIQNRLINCTYYGEYLNTKLNLNSENPFSDLSNRIANGEIDNIFPGDWLYYMPIGGSRPMRPTVVGIDINNYYENKNNHYIDFIIRDSVYGTIENFNDGAANNNGYPDQIENLTGDGTTTDFILTKKLYRIDNVTINNIETDDYTYDYETKTISFNTAPDNEANITVKMNSETNPWRASRLYLYANSEKGNCCNGKNIEYKDYTSGGIYSALPNDLKINIKNKIVNDESRTNSTMTATTSTFKENVDIGKIWIPSCYELFGQTPSIYCGDKQYPLFSYRSTKKFRGETTSRASYWTRTPSSNTDTQFIIATINGTYTAQSSASGGSRLVYGFRL